MTRTDTTPLTEPEIVIRCSIHSAWLDRAVPTVLLITTVGGGFALVGHFLQRAPDALQTVGGAVIAVALAVTTFLAFKLWFSTQNQVALYRDRLVLDPNLRGPARGRIQIAFTDMRRVVLEGDRVRIEFGDGLEFGMRPTRLQAEEAFEFLAHLVGACNPHCRIERNGA